MHDNYHLLIMAGGQGQRLWPLSDTTLPKQFHPFLSNGTTLLQATANRFKSLMRVENIWVVTQACHVSLVQQQLPQINPAQILSEPVGRNTAACIAYACAAVTALYADVQLIVVPADHIIQKESIFTHALQQALQFTENIDSLILLGAPAYKPETGYGYIGYASHSSEPIKRVVNFVEKPPKKKAQALIEAGNYAWNTGIFVGQAGTFIKNFKAYWPSWWNKFLGIYVSELNQEEKQVALENLYQVVPSISFDKAILEVTDHCYVVCADFGWLDLGNWGALYDYLPKDEAYNTCQGNVLTLATHHCLIKANPSQLVVTYGIENLIIVQQGSTLLICHRDQVSNFKKVTEKIHEKGYDAYL